jgi:hypothetical protein
MNARRSNSMASIASTCWGGIGGQRPHALAIGANWGWIARRFNGV